MLTRAAADMSDLAGENAPEDVVGGLDDCAAVMERLRAAQ